MKVGIKDKTTAKPIGEMMGEGEVGVIVGEMVTDPAKLADFGFSSDICAKAASLKEANKDEQPEYAVVRVEEGWSRSRRLWTANTLEGIVLQTNQLEPVGHLGHIQESQASTAFPEPQTTWFGAFTKTEPSKQKDHLGEQVKVAYFAGYNLPGAKVRGYIKSRAVRGISWWGDGEMTPIPGKGVEVKNFVLKHLDWARKGAEGMPSSSIIAVTGEMEGTMDKELSQVTPEEFKKENPNGHALLVAEVNSAHETVIGEMTAKVEDGEKSKSLIARLMEVLGVKDADALEAEIVSMREKVGAKASAMVKTALDALLEEKVPNEEKRALVRRLLPVGEMETKASDAKDADEVAKLVSEMTDAAINSDDVVKGIISEMTPPVVRRREELRGGGDPLKDNIYVPERERVTLGS